MDTMWVKLPSLCIFIVFCGIYANSQRVVHVGNEIKPSASGVDFANITFLLENVVLSDGVLFAFSAYFRSYSAVRLQIWRPVGNGSEALLFELISQLRVIPAGIYQREDVYIESKLTGECTKVQKGDRLGLYVEETPGSVTYTFIPTKPSTLSSSKPIEVNATYNASISMLFDKLTFPYEFSLAAYIDTDMSQYDDPDTLHPDCPKGLLIPQYGVLPSGTTGPSVVSGAPGDTGATGPDGQKGEQGDTGFVGSLGYTGATGPMGVAGVQGIQGEPGEDGTDGENGVPGGRGLPGPQGKDGLRGLPGSPGPAGPPGDMDFITVEPKQLAVTQKDHALLNPMLILGILIWLVIITILIIVVLLVLLWFLYKLKKRELAEARQQTTTKNNSNFLFDSQTSPANNNEDTWMQSMKEQAESQYKLDTILDPKRNTSGSQGKYTEGGSNCRKATRYGKPDIYGDSNDLSHRNSVSKNDSYTSNQSFGAINSIYKNLDVPHYEVKNC